MADNAPSRVLRRKNPAKQLNPLDSKIASCLDELDDDEPPSGSNT